MEMILNESISTYNNYYSIEIYLFLSGNYFLLSFRKHDIAEMPRIQKCLTKSMLETNNNHNNKYDTLHLSKHILQYFCLEIEPFTYISYILCREQNWSKFFLVSEKI